MKVSVQFKYCYGIKHLEFTFNFSERNVIAVYARNGTMKTSFAKTLKKIQMEQAEEICDAIFEIKGTASVKADNRDIKTTELFVINSFETAYQSNLSPLLVNEEIKNHLHDLFQVKEKLFRTLEALSGLRETRTREGKMVYELEETIIHDLGLKSDGFLRALSRLEPCPSEDFSFVQYCQIFNESVEKKIKTKEFQTAIREYIDYGDKLYKAHEFLRKGNLTLPRLREIHKELEKDRYFCERNTIVLAGLPPIRTDAELGEIIKALDGELKNSPALHKIEKLLSDVKGSLFKDVIEMHPELLDWLTTERLPSLRKLLWYSYFQKTRAELDLLRQKYSELSHEIGEIKTEDTPWQKILQIYKQRFFVPYELEISNLQSSIIGESVPKVEFLFKSDGQTCRMNRDRLETLNTLSQGEKRALYLLNVICDIEKVKQKTKQDERVLFIIDDIADSFDYKNKYAIVEYLYEMAQDPRFKLIILSHNFDFFRTIVSRLYIPRSNCLYACSSDSSVSLINAPYLKQPIQYWKDNPTEEVVIAMIPFVRNLCEYGQDRHIGKQNGKRCSDYTILTNLLHEKEGTDKILFADLKDIYQEYLGIDITQVQQSKPILATLYEICDNMTTKNCMLEDKIILSMAIRHKAERFMENRLREYNGIIIGQSKNPKKAGEIRKETGTAFLERIKKEANQTRALLDGYMQIGTQVDLAILRRVAILTPENIHINAFMYEPIMDMDIEDLLSLYRQTKSLCEPL